MKFSEIINNLCKKWNIYNGNIKINCSEGKFKNIRLEKTPTLEEIKEIEEIPNIAGSSG
ncbi:MAG: hypothetical protein ACFFG0_03490 [Candidatus Thorarchaeota archaeon]